jgi:uncharacterized membrane-anchored protein YhcB (DUF1043 family)
MFFTIMVGIICGLVGILVGCLIERHFATQAKAEEMTDQEAFAYYSNPANREPVPGSSPRRKP